MLVSALFIWGFFLVPSYCAPTSLDDVEEISWDTTLERLLYWRQKYLTDMDHVKLIIEKSVEEGNSTSIKEALEKFDNTIWPRLVDLSSKIFSKVPSDDRQSNLEREINFQESLKNKGALIRFTAGRRKCENPNEAYYPKTNRCEKLGNRFTTEAENPCPKNQLFYEIDNNEGVCDCAANSFKFDQDQLVYAMDGQCYQQNEKGPCKKGEWLLFINGVPKCERVPGNCPADGKHVYGKPDGAGNKNEGCFVLGEQGPCEFGLVFRTDTRSLKCRPQIIIDPAWVFGPLPPLSEVQTPCASSSFRAQNNLCKS